MVTRQAAARRKGATFETDVLKWVRGQGLDAERLRLTGRLDEGDIAVQDVGIVYVIEAKAEKTMDLSGYVRESEAEAANYAASRPRVGDVMPLVVIKRRNQPVSKAYVVTTLENFFA